MLWSGMHWKFSSVQLLSCVWSLQPHRMQHARLSCPSPTPGIYSNSCTLSWWCHPTISFFVIPFSACIQSFLASWSSWINQFFTSGGQSIGVSASVLPMNIQDWFPSGLTGLISLQSKGLSRVLSKNHSSKTSILWCSAFFIVQLSHPYLTIGKATALSRWTVVGKVMSLLFNMLPRLVITFLTRSKCLLISWLHSISSVILEPKKIKSVTVSIVSPPNCHRVMGLYAMILVFWILCSKPAYFTHIFHFHQEAL